MTPDNESCDAAVDLVHLQQRETGKKGAQKASKGARRDPEQYNDITESIELPDPEHRSHAGHVARNQARRTRAEPPPPNPHRHGRTSQRHEQRQERKKKGSLGDDDDESDSDADKNNRRKINDDGNVVKRERRLEAKSEPHPQPVPGPSTRVPLLDQEEMERLDKFRTLKAFEESTRKLIEHRKICEHDAVYRMRYLRNQEYPAPSRADMRGFEKENRRFREYLEDSLYHDIMAGREADSNDADGLESPEWHQIVLSAEQSLLERCHRFDKLLHLKDLNTSTYLEDAFEQMQKQVWEQITRDERPQQVDVSQAVRAFVRENCEYNSTNTSTATIVDNLMSKLTIDLEQAIETRLSDTRAESKLPSLPICDVLSTSRPPKKSKLKQEYVEWVLRDIGDSELKSIRLNWRREQRKMAIQTFREQSDFLSITMWQDFIPNLVEEDTVSLVLFKGTSLVTVKAVTSTELASIGWRMDENKEYWRYLAWRGDAYKINMDGEVLAIVVGTDDGISFQEYRT